MKTMMRFALAIVAMAPLAETGHAAPASGGSTVSLNLGGIRAAEGDLYVSLQTRAQFMKPAGSYGTILRKPAAGSRTVTLTGVEPGDYAVSVWHDINNNRRFDRAENGVPTDGWAMLNAEGLRAAPTFDQVKFPVAGAAKTVKLEMHYGR